MSEWWRFDGFPTADEWQAVCSFEAVIVAVVLLMFAWKQLEDLAESNRGLANSNELLAESNRVLSRPTVLAQFESERVPKRNYTNQENANTVFITVENLGVSPALAV